MEYSIDEMKKEDWIQVGSIYKEGIETGNATFQTEIPTWEDWDKGHISKCRLVARQENKILGWIALSPVSSRCVYSGVAEVSIYIKEQYRGNRIGENLLSKLIECSETNGFWTLQSGIFVENHASLALHKKCGFRVIGIREKFGKSNRGGWRDIVFLERRSKVVGIDQRSN
ncbi:GNAT family N-acetyltransferase [Marinisporobacter balticus]|uniref:Phosphinothricin acetyltransferase n=1 Tax=Marinisporobacter balticus TaxID=2018667 RepID=A0A4R2KTM3_9FIRM|nr:GNAT family N-acetyltransferase [Marinisporobacter balticus]TCO74429.1 phosphinothricin acetyltransferase [Marinisporobacter balticus]